MEKPEKEYCEKCKQQVHEFEADFGGTVHKLVRGKLIAYHSSCYHNEGKSKPIISLTSTT